MKFTRIVLFLIMLCATALIPSNAERPILNKPPQTVQNRDGSLSGLNMDNQIALWIQPTRMSAKYVLFAAPAARGPWQKIQIIDAKMIGDKPLFSTVDDGDETADGHPRNSTGAFKDSPTFYRLTAVDEKGKTIKRYPTIRIPALSEKPQ
jgi:hypothetical protein